MGLQHNYQFGKNTWGQAVISASGARVNSDVDTLLAGNVPRPSYRDASQNTRYSVRYTAGHRVNTRLNFKGGVYSDVFGFKLERQFANLGRQLSAPEESDG